jgi:hypothetical protein
MGMMLIPGYQLPPPGKCASCGDTDRDCVDFGITIDYYGAVLICTLCLRSAAAEWPNVISLIDTGMYQELSQEYDKLYAENQAIPNMIEEVRNELFDIINSLSNRLKRYSEQLSDKSANPGYDARTAREPKETERQTDSDVGLQESVRVSGSAGDGDDDPFLRTDF